LNTPGPRHVLYDALSSAGDEVREPTGASGVAVPPGALLDFIIQDLILPDRTEANSSVCRAVSGRRERPC
jgi:hypothetical protein